MTTLAELYEQDLLERTHHEETSQNPLPPAPHAGPRFFANVLLEVDSTEQRRRKWSAASSLVLQCLVLASLLILPLMFTEVLPKGQLLTYLVAPPPPPPPPPPAAAPAPAQLIRHPESDLMDGRLRTPSRIPSKVQMIREEEAPPQVYTGGVVGGVEGGMPGGQLGGVIGGIISSTSTLASVPKLAPPAKRVRVSQGVVAGMVTHKVEPPYPALARAARIQGQVVLTAVISKEGTIENLQVVSGHPMLVPAALTAVKEWLYRPYFVSGEPVEVDTTIVVTFKLSE